MKPPVTFLRLYVNPAWRREGFFSPLLFPWWGNPVPESSLFAKELFDSFSFDTRLYGITDDITKADMVFAPYRQATLRRHYPELLVECAQTAKDAGLPLLVDGIADGEQPLNIENAYVMRYGGYRFLQKEQSAWGLPPHIRWEPNRINVPTQADDLLLRCTDGELKIRHKSEGKPIVGFVGMTKTTFKNMVRTRLEELPFHLRGILDDRYIAMTRGIFWRSQALRILMRSKNVICNFKGRDFFSGSSRTSPIDLRKIQREFVQTILESDYALDVRGDANASVRLYEILSLGRIPVILDTERYLPFSDVVDYRTFSLIVGFRDINRLPDIIAEFHKNISPENFEQMQRNARAAFVNHFRVDAQMPHILRKLNELHAFDLH